MASVLTVIVLLPAGQAPNGAPDRQDPRNDLARSVPAKVIR
jgi:hypothetical protein